MRIFITFISIVFLGLSCFSQKGLLAGRVLQGERGIPFATVFIPILDRGTTTDADGHFELKEIPPGTYLIESRALGFSVYRDSVFIVAGERVDKEIILKQDLIHLEQIVVSGTRSGVPVFEAPVIVSQIDQRLFDRTQSVTLSEGLAFSPGLRLENNCQNCGFTQLRMNGLDGAYSQILINSRPIFSSLVGVYGLELIPANMIDRIEIVRGGGSALYGGNAIAGTVNIITKDPLNNSFQVGLNQALINMEASDRSVSLNGSIVGENLDIGMNLYGFNRNRQQWDANEDGFSEMTLIENYTFGFDAYLKPTVRSRIELNGFAINEYRRGGNNFDLEPHQTDLTEELDHEILGGALSYEVFSKDYRHKFSAYASGQSTQRGSYYGGGGRILNPGDSLTESDLLALNAYGSSDDLSLAGGLQYSFNINPQVNLVTGSEYQFNEVSDRMPGYGRSIDQRVFTLGHYAQLELKPLEKVTVLAGSRFDFVDIQGIYNFGEESFSNYRNLPVFLPRLSLMYEISKDLKARGSFAQGYRAPQAFNEDLHIETVGGSARFIQLDSKLEVERSNSYTASLNYARVNDHFQFNYVLEAFYTDLRNPFIISNPVEFPSGVSVATKRNGTGAFVSGVNFEANLSWREKWLLNAGFTLQKGEYDEAEVIWAPDAPDSDGVESVVTSRNLLRTPSAYGYFSLTYNTGAWGVTWSGVFTGSMDVPHVIDPETEYTTIKQTPVFLENSFKASHTLPFDIKKRLEIFAGIQNMFNSYQSDFDIGSERDAGYIYGPIRPRTLFFGIKFNLE